MEAGIKTELDKANLSNLGTYGRRVFADYRRAKKIALFFGIILFALTSPLYVWAGNGELGTKGIVFGVIFGCALIAYLVWFSIEEIKVYKYYLTCAYQIAGTAALNR